METCGAGIVDGLDHGIVVEAGSGVIHRPEVVVRVTCWRIIIPTWPISVESLRMLDAVLNGHVVAVLVERTVTASMLGMASLRPNW